MYDWYMCGCVYVYIYIYIHTPYKLYAYAYVYIYIHIHIYIHMYMFVCMYICTCIDAINTCMHDSRTANIGHVWYEPRSNASLTLTQSPMHQKPYQMPV